MVLFLIKIEQTDTCYDEIMSNDIDITGKYRHYKGNVYEVIGTGIHTETEEKMVIYKALYKPYHVWLRPYDMFFSMVKNNDKEIPRFTKIEIWHTPQQFIDTLHKDLLKARKARDTTKSEALQSVIAAIDNAGAVSVNEEINSLGVGSTEAMRQELSISDIRKIITSEIVEMQQAIDVLNGIKNNFTDELDRKITLLKVYL